MFGVASKHGWKHGRRCALLLAVCCWSECSASAAEDTHRGIPWPRHAIDDSTRGADGARPRDVNGDGLLDFVTGWEEGSVVRAYLHPGIQRVRDKWPGVTVGRVASPEDAVFVDLDGDGAVDVVSSCEGKTRGVFVHWAPREQAKYLDESAWRTEPLHPVVGMCQWMFALPMEIDGRRCVDLVVGGKNEGAKIGWLESPADPRNLTTWRWHPLYDAGWIMSIVARDMDGDGDLDVLASDRKGPSRGCLWLENPGRERAPAGTWPIHRVGDGSAEVMFLEAADLDRDGLEDVLVATRDRGLIFHRRLSAEGTTWRSFPIRLAADTGGAKSVRVADVDLDGRLDLVYTCEGAENGRSGAVWLSYRQVVTDRDWLAHEISGPQGIKFDLAELADLDADGDLDLVTTEERQGLGVIWYENPSRP